MVKLFVSLIVCLICYSSAFAEPAITCHCFRDRSFNAENPGKVDAYLLATTQNSLLASVFGIHKKEIVSAKMSGTPGDDLWVAYFVADKTRVDFDNLMASRKKNKSPWKTILSQQGIVASRLGRKFNKALTAEEPDTILSALIVDQMLVKRLGAKNKDIKRLRKKRASTKEVILAIIFSLQSGRPASEFYTTVKSGQITWGSHLNSMGLKAKGMESVVKKRLKYGLNKSGNMLKGSH